MKPLSSILGVFAGLAVGTGALAQSPASWTTPTAPFKIADNLYYVGTAGISSFLITTDEGHVLIDGGMPGSAKDIKASIQALGFASAEVKVLVNSHAHFDHAGGLADLKRDTDAKLAASAEDRAALETGKYIGSEDVKAFDFPPVKVDRVLKDGDTVRLGDAVLTAHITPGHTAGCTTWTFPVTIEGVRHEAVLYCSTSVAANRLVSKTKGPQYPGIVEDYRAAFTRLKSIKADVFLAPHAEQFDMAAKRARLAAGGANPFIDPTALSRTVVQSQAAFERELAKQQEAAK